MAEVTNSFDMTMLKAVVSLSSSSVVDYSFGDDCSICLDPFSSEDPSTVTSCKHEYHLQCILEWSQRSKECPICWQDTVLKEPSNQELLDAVEIERNVRAGQPSPTTFQILQLPQAASAGGALYHSRRESQGSSGINPTQDLTIPPPINIPNEHQTHTSPEECHGHEIVDASSNSTLPSTMTSQPPMLTDPSVGDTGSTSTVNRNLPLQSRSPLNHLQSDRQQRPSPKLSFSDNMKLRISATSSRCKESMSKGRKVFKEKLLKRFRFSKHSASSVSNRSCTARTSNNSLRCKSVQNGNDRVIPRFNSSISRSYV